MPLLYLPRQFHVQSDGAPLAGAKLYTYRAGTTTNLDVYTTSALSVAHANPVVADANGIFPAIYVNPASGYDLKVVLTTSADVTVYTEDNIPRQETQFSTITATGLITTPGDVRSTNGHVRAFQSLECIGNNPRVYLSESDQASDEKVWDWDVSAKVMSLRTRTDADAGGNNAIVVTRGTGTAISSIAIGNVTNNPTISFNGTEVISTGTFTGTLTGMDAATTGTIHYKRTGKQVTLHNAASPGYILGTSNSVACAMTGLPANLYPAVAQTVPCIVEDDGNVLMGNAVIGTNGTITFGKLAVSGANITISNDFTNSGTKGVPPNWSLTYAL